MSKHHSDISKFLSFVLRHEPQAIGLTLDSEGWAELDALIAGAGAHGTALDLELIQAVVAGSDKKRFALSADGQRIRAVQGHSTPAVDLQLEARVPPEVLYHGTATRFLEAIMAEACAAASVTMCICPTTRRPPHRWGSATASRWCCRSMPGACIATACRSSRPTTASGSPRRFRRRS